MASATAQDGTRFARLVENLVQTWAPADPTEQWLARGDVTGDQRWVLGTEEQARAAGVATTNTWPEGDERARCGDFSVEPAQQCREPGGWRHPTAEWQAGRPPTPTNCSNACGTTFPRRGRLPRGADVGPGRHRAAQRPGGRGRAGQALPGAGAAARSPGGRPAGGLDGRTGTAPGVDDGHVRQEIIIDPGTGRFIGERRVATRDVDGLTAGTVLTSTSVEIGIGVEPGP
ncbi:hypothetical protein [Actinokineospora pegani]|uniref:hypothetical protein n=1 Tax=Actinokineospora pegani TaxID=2654637 RepID=UPI0012EAF1FC|nr:hypothetical protein [Actinokineospora pegani]